MKFFFGLVPGIYTVDKNYYFGSKIGLITMFLYVEGRPLVAFSACYHERKWEPVKASTTWEI